MITRSKLFSLFFFFHILFAAGCTDFYDDKPWWSAIPAESPLVILYHGTDFSTALQERKSLFFEEVSDINMETAAAVADRHSGSLSLNAVALIPFGSHQLQPLFILEDPGHGIGNISARFRKTFAENSYRFEKHTVHIMHLEGRQLFAAQAGNRVLMSPGSAAVEKGLLAYTGRQPGLAIREEQLASGNFLLQTSALDNWIKLLGAPRYLPRFFGLFEGTGPAVLQVSSERYNDPLHDHNITGTFPVNRREASSFVSNFTSDPAPFDLDRYVPVDAAFFAVYHLDALTPGQIDVQPTSRLDSMLLRNPSRSAEILQTLAPPAAFAAFEASGFLTRGEHMYLRRLDDPSGFSRILRELEQDGFIEISNDLYYINSTLLGQMLGGSHSRLTDFYVMRSANAAIITKRSGLARRIDQDRRRRAVFYYDDAYMAARQRHPETISVWMYSRTNPLMNYLEPMLNPVNHARYLSTLLDVGTLSLVRRGDHMSLQMDTYFSEDRSDPVRELWVYDLDGGRITGRPVLANIGGGSRDELVVATDRNQIIGIAADGTGFLETSTGNDRPVGTPVVYDWYSNNQHAILIAAGNKIYAWNARGFPLPNFPVSLDERITTPLVLADITRNGRPEMIVATADRKIHVLDQRGLNIQGWPQDMNVEASHKPVFHSFMGDHLLWVTAGNGLFAFSPRGNLRDDFPIFIDSDFGPLTFHGNHILAGAADGHLYAIGIEPFFADTLVADMNNAGLSVGSMQNARASNVSLHDGGISTVSLQDGRPPSGSSQTENNRGSMKIRRVYIGNSPVINAPIVQTLAIQHGSGSRIRERMIAVQNLNGNIFLLNEAGQLRMTRNMGQQAADYDNLLITDVNGDGITDIAALSSTGRLYAWQIESGEEVANIPSASMRYPLVADLLANGERELIGQTRNGLSCWSFRKP